MNLFVSTPKRKDFHYGYKDFHYSPPNLQRIYSVYYKDAKENDQTIFLHMAFFVTYGVN